MYCMTFSITLLKLLLLFRKQEVCRVFIESFLSCSASQVLHRDSKNLVLHILSHGAFFKRELGISLVLVITTYA